MEQARNVIREAEEEKGEYEEKLKNVVFWDIALCGSCVNRRFGGTYRLNLQGRKVCDRGTNVSRWPRPRRQHSS
jgi:hypothetical protein